MIELLRTGRPEPLEEKLRPDRDPSGTPGLRSARLALVEPQTQHADALSHLANNPRIATMVSRMPHPYTVNDASDFILRAGRGEMGKRVYAITRAADNTLMGCCGFNEINPQRAEIGYWLGQPFWNRGYATEAAQVLIDEAFSVYGYREVEAYCRVINIGSRRVLQKCGFQFRGTAMVPCLAENTMVAAEWYGLDQRTWRSLRQWGGRA